MAISRIVIFAFILGCSTKNIGSGTNDLPQLPDNLAYLTPSGETFDLASVISSHKATVLVWWATKCPCVTRYQSRMETVAKTHAQTDLAVIAVASNADDSPEKITRVAKERRFELPLIVDQDAKLAKALEVRTTPTAVIIDQQGQVRFRGWIDNERMPGEPNRVAYLENALNQVLADQSVSESIAPSFGCMITKRL